MVASSINVDSYIKSYYDGGHLVLVDDIYYFVMTLEGIRISKNEILELYYVYTYMNISNKSMISFWEN